MRKIVILFTLGSFLWLVWFLYSFESVKPYKTMNPAEVRQYLQDCKDRNGTTSLDFDGEEWTLGCSQ